MSLDHTVLSVTAFNAWEGVIRLASTLVERPLRQPWLSASECIVCCLAGVTDDSRDLLLAHIDYVCRGVPINITDKLQYNANSFLAACLDEGMRPCDLPNLRSQLEHRGDEMYIYRVVRRTSHVSWEDTAEAVLQSIARYCLPRETAYFTDILSDIS